MAMAGNGERYDRVSIVLHWAVAIGILALAGLELFRHEFPKGSFIREGLKPIHQPAGTVLLMLILARIGWSFTFQRKPASEGGFAGLASKLVHVALYGLMVAIPAVGLASVLGAGKTVDFGAFALSAPLQPLIGAYAKGLRSLHEDLAMAMLGLVLLHAVAALAHHYLLGDGVLRRMLPGGRRGSTPTLSPAE